jgi:uncharacterized protein (DUF2132 family)
MPRMRELFEQHGWSKTFDRVVGNLAIQEPSVRSTM